MHACKQALVLGSPRALIRALDAIIRTHARASRCAPNNTLLLYQKNSLLVNGYFSRRKYIKTLFELLKLQLCILIMQRQPLEKNTRKLSEWSKMKSMQIKIEF